jgi:Fe-S oxidoreductase
VDMATYKAEFLSHYYERNRRPLHAYAFGLVDKWLRFASIAPGLADALNRTPVLSALARKIIGLAPQRELPRLAPVDFRRWAKKNGVPDVRHVSELDPDTERGGAPKNIILWADTFNNYLHPETSRAAFAVLHSAGFNVKVPHQHLCCGRPLYDFGMLDEAKDYLRIVLGALAEPLDAGTPIVVLEPSCASVFRDELCNLMPGNPRAVRLRSQTFLLSEFLEHHAPGFQPPRLSGKVLLHGHCHQKSLMKMKDEESLLRKMGAELQSLDSGCCGMAGPFGFEKDKYAVSQAIGERVLLPAVRNAPTDWLIISDGFSCREQIQQATGRKAVHLAEAIQLAAQSSAQD